MIKPWQLSQDQLSIKHREQGSPCILSYQQRRVVTLHPLPCPLLQEVEPQW